MIVDYLHTENTDGHGCPQADSFWGEQQLTEMDHELKEKNIDIHGWHRWTQMSVRRRTGVRNNFWWVIDDSVDKYAGFWWFVWWIDRICIFLQAQLGYINLYIHHTIMASDNNNIKLTTLEYNNLYSEVCDIIDSTRQQLAAAFTNMQLLMYWSIGNRINKDVLCGKRAEYGAQIVSTLSTQLQRQYGDEYSERNLRRMMQFARTPISFHLQD